MTQYRLFRGGYTPSLVHLFSSGWPATWVTRFSHIACCSQWTRKKGNQLLLTCSNGERAKNSKGTHLGSSYQCQNMNGNDLTAKIKQNIHSHKGKSCNLNDINRQTQGPIGLYELFLLTVPIEEVARWQQETVLTKYPLNLQTIITAFDFV